MDGVCIVSQQLAEVRVASCEVEARNVLHP